MDEQVWFLSVVLNGRFSVTSIVALTPELAIEDAEVFLTCISGYTPRDCKITTITLAKGEAYALISESFAATLLKS